MKYKTGKYKTSLAALLLSAALISAPTLSGNAYAHDDSDKSAHKMYCEHEFLSKAHRELLHSTMKQVHEDNKAVFEEMHKLFKEKQDILAAKTFDKDAFLSVAAKIEEKRDQLEKARVEAFASIADKFTPAEREHLGRMFGHHHHGGMHHDGWKHGEGHGDWKHHDGKKDGVSEKPQTPSDNSQGDAAPNSDK
ncbi:MAG: periplasmic heavy metal sensor [Alphaproteobacteria bacterium]